MPPRWQTLLTRAAGLAAREAADTWLRYREEEARALREAWEAQRDTDRMRARAQAQAIAGAAGAREAAGARAGQTWAGFHWPPPPGTSPKPAPDAGPSRSRRARRKAGARAEAGASTGARAGASAEAGVRSPYAVLGVPEGTSIEACEAMFKALSLIHHPDRGGDGAKLARATAAITEIRKAHGRGRAKD